MDPADELHLLLDQYLKIDDTKIPPRVVADEYTRLSNLFNALVVSPVVPCELSVSAGTELLNMIKKRFQNYKTHAVLAVHYVVYDADGKVVRDYAAEMLAKLDKGIRCAGVQDGRGCTVKFDRTVIESDGLKKAFKGIEFDHRVERKKDINRATRDAVKACEDKPDVQTAVKQLGSASAMAAFAEVTESALKTVLALKKNNKSSKTRDVFAAVEKYIDLDRLREDLYGDGILVRCSQCHTLGEEEHEDAEDDRYVKDI